MISSLFGVEMDVDFEIIDIPDGPPEQFEGDEDESSAKFCKLIFLGRQMESRRRPWFKTMPVRTILLTMYRTISASNTVQPFQLIWLGNILLGFVKNLSADDKGQPVEDHQGPGSSLLGLGSRLTLNKKENDRDLDKYLEVLETIFGRLKQFGDNDDEQRKFLDSVWELHTNGTLDLSKTNIPGLMVNSCPERLDNVLSSCLEPDPGNMCPSPLIPLCDRSPENFLSTMQFLRIKYFDSTPEQRTLLLDFGCRLQQQLRQKLWNGSGRDGYASLFPSVFHPLIHVVSEILRCPWPDIVFQNETVIQELCHLVNQASYQAELVKFNSSDMIFILATIPDLPCDVIFNRASYKYNGNLWLKRCLKRGEIRLPTSVS